MLASTCFILGRMLICQPCESPWIVRMQASDAASGAGKPASSGLCRNFCARMTTLNPEDAASSFLASVGVASNVADTSTSTPASGYVTQSYMPDSQFANLCRTRPTLGYVERGTGGFLEKWACGPVNS
jgi:hypothetical protein